MSELNQNNGQTTGDQGSVSFNLGNMSEPTSMPEQPMPQTVEPDNGVSDLNIAEVTATPATATEQTSGFSKRMKLIIAALIGFAVLTGLVAVYFLGGDLFRGSLTPGQPETLSETQLRESLIIEVVGGENITQCEANNPDPDCLFIPANTQNKDIKLNYGFDFGVDGVIEAKADLYLQNRDEKADANKYFLGQAIQLTSDSNGFTKLTNQSFTIQNSVPSGAYKVYLAIQLTKFTATETKVNENTVTNTWLDNKTNSLETVGINEETKALEGGQQVVELNKNSFDIQVKSTVEIKLDPSIPQDPDRVSENKLTLKGTIGNPTAQKIAIIEALVDGEIKASTQSDSTETSVAFEFSDFSLNNGQNVIVIVVRGTEGQLLGKKSFTLTFAPATAYKTNFWHQLIPTARAVQTPPNQINELIQQNRIIITNARDFADSLDGFVLENETTEHNENLTSVKAARETETNRGEIADITINIRDIVGATFDFNNNLRTDMFRLELPEDATTELIIDGVEYINPNNAKLKIKTAPNRSHNSENNLAIDVVIDPDAFTQVSNISRPQRLADQIGIGFKDPVITLEPILVRESNNNNGTLENLTLNIESGAKFVQNLQPRSFNIPGNNNFSIRAVNRLSDKKLALQIQAINHQASNNMADLQIAVLENAFVDNDRDELSETKFAVEFSNNTLENGGGVEQAAQDQLPENDGDGADPIPETDGGGATAEQVVGMGNGQPDQPPNNQNEPNRAIVQLKSRIDELRNIDELDLNNLDFELAEASSNDGTLPEIFVGIFSGEFKSNTVLKKEDFELSANATAKGIKIKTVRGNGDQGATIVLETTSGHTVAQNVDNVNITVKNSALKTPIGGSADYATTNNFEIQFLDPVVATNNNGNVDNPPATTPPQQAPTNNPEQPPVNQQPTIVRETTAPVVTTPRQSTPITSNETTQFDRVVTTFDNSNTDPRIVRQSEPDAQANIISSPGIQGTTGPAALAYPLLAAGSYFLARRKARK